MDPLLIGVPILAARGLLAARGGGGLDGLRELREEIKELRDEIDELRRELGELRERIARLEAMISELKYWIERCGDGVDGEKEEGNGDRIRLILFIILVLLSLIASVMGVELPWKK